MAVIYGWQKGRGQGQMARDKRTRGLGRYNIRPTKRNNDFLRPPPSPATPPTILKRLEKMILAVRPDQTNRMWTKMVHRVMTNGDRSLGTCPAKCYWYHPRDLKSIKARSSGCDWWGHGKPQSRESLSLDNIDQRISTQKEKSHQRYLEKGFIAYSLPSSWERMQVCRRKGL